MVTVMVTVIISCSPVYSCICSPVYSCKCTCTESGKEMDSPRLYMCMCMCMYICTCTESGKEMDSPRLYDESKIVPSISEPS